MQIFVFFNQRIIDEMKQNSLYIMKCLNIQLFQSIYYINFAFSTQMSKRPASYDIDEHTFEEKEKVKEGGQSIDDEGKHMANRRIFKIRKDDSGVSQPTRSVDLKIKGMIDNNDKKDTPKDIKTPENPFKLNLFNQSQGVGLFSNILSNPTPPKNELFKDNASKEPAKLPVSGSLFDNSNKTEPKGGLFSNITPSSSLFGNNSLFSNPNPSSILFGGSTGNLNFGTSLFGNKISGPITAPPERPEDDSGDSQQLEKDQQMVVDPTKSEVKFDYGQQDQIVKKIAASKYKKDKGNLVENVEAIIKFNSDKKFHSLLIRLVATKNIIFTGVLLPHKSSTKRNGENIDILVFTLEKETLVPHRVKLQIKGSDNDLGEFYQQLQKIIEGNSQTKSE